MNLKERLAALEVAVMGKPGEMAFDPETWLREREEGISVEEQERRRIAEHPEQAEELHAIYRQIAEWRARLHGEGEEGGE